jgi:hypothetical protein
MTGLSPGCRDQHRRDHHARYRHGSERWNSWTQPAQSTMRLFGGRAFLPLDDSLAELALELDGHRRCQRAHVFA